MLPHEHIKKLLPFTSLSCLNFDDEFPFVPMLTPDWKSASTRILFVIETVDSCDLKETSSPQTLLRSVVKKDRFGGKQELNTMLVTFSNLLNLSWLELLRWDKAASFDDSAIGVVNFCATRYLKMSPAERRNAEAKCNERVRKIIAKLKPTCVVSMGHTVTKYLLPEEKAVSVKHGWIIPFECQGWKTQVVPTLDLNALYAGKNNEDSDEDSESDASAAGDLLYFVSRNVANAFAGRHLFSAAQIKPKPIYVDSMEKFDKLFSLLKTASVIAFDSETANLESYNNRIYTAQFSVSSDKGYILPLWHPKTPFTKDELLVIAKKLARLFSTTKPEMQKTFVVLNGAFDFRVFRAQLGIPIIHHKIWDVTAGEVLLDENMGLFNRISFFESGKSVKVGYGNLRNLFVYYDNDYYYTAEFSKEERDTIGSVDLATHEGARDYCVMDCQSIFSIYELQKTRAATIKVRRSLTSKLEPFLPLYIAHVENQMSNTVHAISHMTQNGSYVDVDYLDYLMSDKSPLIMLRAETEKELLSMPSVAKANSVLMKESGLAASSLFKTKVNLFSINKPAHKQLLFFDIMELEPVSFTSVSKTRAVDKDFFAAYKDDYTEVALMYNWSKISKLLGTYVKGWQTKIVESKDAKADSHIRPSFGFFSIVTGRLNSFKPSLQQVPSRGPLSKYIKRMFRAPKGNLLMKWDFSAHEVRLWGIMSQDDKLASAFKAGQRLRQQLIKNPTDELRKELKQKGDIHIQNIYLIFNKWVDKSDPLRDSIKAIIFGLLYGKGASTLSKDIRNNTMSGLVAKAKAIEKKPANEVTDADKKELVSLNKQIRDLECRDPKDMLAEAEATIEKIFTTFKKGKKFLTECEEQSANYAYVMSPIGRRRNLYRVFTGRQNAIADAERRAKNSPIQGFASEIGATCAYLVLKEAHRYMSDNDVDVSCFPLLARCVHDANYYEVPYAMVIPFAHIMQYVATYGVTKYYKDIFGFEFNVEPEIEIEVAVTEDKSKKWSWELPEFILHIQECLKEQVALGDITAQESKHVAKLIFEPWKNTRTRTYLQKNFPLLGVTDLHEEIKEAIRPIYSN